MRIISLQTENYKRLKAVEITPKGDVVIISGKNGEGKSSVLDSIWAALAGAPGAKETTRPIRDGEEKASVRLDLGDYVVTRRWTRSGSTLEVTPRDGAAKYASPQKLLDTLIGQLTFDPLAFANQDEKKQRKILLDVVALPFDPDEVAEQRQGVYDERTDVNREVKRLETLLNELPPLFADAPDEEVSAAEIAKELETANDTHQKHVDYETKVDKARDEVHRLEGELADAKGKLERVVEERSDLPELIDPDPIRQRLADADETNAAVRTKKERAKVRRELADATNKSADFTAKLAKIDDDTARAIAEANMPLDGLAFDETGVLYQGVPFAQASSAEKLRVSIAIAMALNPEIRVIRITDGSLLDSANMALIEEMAADNDFQVWCEVVSDTDTGVGVYIEDGSVVTP